MDKRDDTRQSISDNGTSHGLSNSPEFVYLIPYGSKSDRDIGFVELCSILWKRKVQIFVSMVISMGIAITYAIIAPEWYRADTVLAPADEVSTTGLQGRSGMLGSLAGIAGISIGGGGSVEPIAVIRSRDFTRQFIEDKDLLTTILYKHWDSENDRWIESDPENRPDIRDAVRYFDENIRSVKEDPETGLVTLSIEWIDPKLAADWANELVFRINEIMRNRALNDATSNVHYLQEQLKLTNVTTLKESIGALLEGELQKLMLAQGNEAFSFRVIDGAEVPKRPVRPNLVVTVALAIILGTIVAVFWILVRFSVSEYRRPSAAR